MNLDVIQTETGVHIVAQVDHGPDEPATQKFYWVPDFSLVERDLNRAIQTAGAERGICLINTQPPVFIIADSLDFAMLLGNIGDYYKRAAE